MSRLTWHCQHIPGWAAEVINNDPVKLIDPPVDNPLPKRQIIGRVYIPDPETNAMCARGAAGAREWWGRVSAFILTRPYVWAWCLPNEPQPVSDWNFCNALADFTIEAARIMHGFGLRVIGGELAEGNPGGATEMERANLFCAIARGLAHCDYWSQHAYWMPDGYPHPEAGYNRWHALRYQMNRGYARARGIKLPPVLLTECGWDFTIGGEPQQGWIGKADWPTYFADLKRFDADLVADTDCLGATIFVSGANQDWYRFEIGENASKDLAAHIASRPNPEVPPMAQSIEVIAADGSKHDMAWLQATYGAGIRVLLAEPPCFRLRQVIIDGSDNVSLNLWVKNAQGLAAVGQPCTYSYPAAGQTDPTVMSSLDLPPIPEAVKSAWCQTGVQNKNLTDGNGFVSFQLGSQSWIKNGRGPYAAWVMSPSIPSDCLDGIGWQMGSAHHGPTQLVFQVIEAAAVPPDPGGPLPENEPILPVGTLADKCRWWLEESIRQDEAGNVARAKAIRYSLIKRAGGLFYRLENALETGKPTG